MKQVRQVGHEWGNEASGASEAQVEQVSVNSTPSSAASGAMLINLTGKASGAKSISDFLLRSQCNIAATKHCDTTRRPFAQHLLPKTITF